MTTRIIRQKRIEKYEELTDRAAELDGNPEYEAELRDEAAALAKTISNGAPDEPRADQWNELYQMQRRRASDLRSNEESVTRQGESMSNSDSADETERTADSDDNTRPGETLGEFFEHPADDGLDQIIGQSDLKQRLDESVITPNESPAQYERLEADAELGYLLFGPPGTGKTLTAKSVASELSVPIAILTPAQLTSKWAGEAPKLVRSVYEEARDVAEAHGGACVMFDEIDSVASERDGDRSKTNTEVQAVSQLLTELQEIQDNETNVLTLGTTNLRESVDTALLRPGRLSTQIEVPAPDGQTRVKLLSNYMPPDEEVDFQNFSEQRFINSTQNYTAADIEGVAAEAKRIAAYESATSDTEYPLRAQHIENAIDRTEGTLSRWNPSDGTGQDSDLQHEIV